MAADSRRLAGVVLIVVPLVAFGGASLLSMIVGQTAGYLDNPVRQDLWRAGHAHAGIMLIISLVLLRYVDETPLRGGWLWIARHGAPLAAILMPAGFFLASAGRGRTTPNRLIVLVYAGALALGIGVASLGIALLTT